MSNSNIRTIGVLALVAFVALSALATPAMAADPTIDTETTHTAEQSSVTDGSTVDDFNGSADSHEQIVFNLTTSDSDATPKLEIVTNSSGETVYSNSSLQNITPSGTDTSTTERTFMANFSHEALFDVERDAGENVTVTAKIYNNTSADSPDINEFSFNLNSTNETAVRLISDADVDDDSDISTTDATSRTIGGYDIPFTGSPASASAAYDDIGVSGADTDVYFVFANDTFQDRVADVTDVSGTKSYAFGGTEAGELLISQQATVNDIPVAVYNEEVADEIDTDAVTYGVLTEADGQDAVMLSLGETAHEDADDIDASTLSGESYGWATLFELTYGYNVPFAGASLGMLGIFGLKRRRGEA